MVVALVFSVVDEGRGKHGALDTSMLETTSSRTAPPEFPSHISPTSKRQAICRFRHVRFKTF